jgi:iron complex outermembrane receptor protein
VYANGFAGTKVSLSADQAGLGRNDRRTIVGGRWERDLTSNTTWRTQGVWDVKDINQPAGATSARGTTPSFILLSDGTRKGPLFGCSSTTYGGGFFKYEDTNSNSYNVMPGGDATLGGYLSGAFGTIVGAGFRFREELAVAERATLVAGFGYEHTNLSAGELLYAYSATGAPSTTVVNASRAYDNVAPEAALLFRVSDSLRLHARLGTGYGTPTNSAFFITPQGTYGNNTQLKAQTNIGIDLGADWFLARNIQLSATGFDERFTNENVTQSPGAGLLSYTFNAPSSAHRGVVTGFDWHPLPKTLSGLRFRTAYQMDLQVYRDYTERLSAGNFSTALVRNGKRIPGVVPNNLNARLAYEKASGVMAISAATSRRTTGPPIVSTMPTLSTRRPPRYSTTTSTTIRQQVIGFGRAHTSTSICRTWQTGPSSARRAISRTASVRVPDYKTEPQLSWQQPVPSTPERRACPSVDSGSSFSRCLFEPCRGR